MEDQDIVAYKSSFIPNMNINLVFKENPNYGMMRKIFDQYGYGFLAPEFKTILKGITNLRSVDEVDIKIEMIKHTEVPFNETLLKCLNQSLTHN